jgi:hypothetical protein
MKNEENKLDYNEIPLILFVLIAGWILLFQSGLFY